MATALQYADTVLSEYAINDMGTGLTTLQATAVKFWNQCKAAGAARVLQTTTLPQAASTDGFTTLAGQTPVASTLTRQAWNAWLRDGAPLASGTPAAVGTADPAAVRAGQSGHPLHAVVEVAQAVEDPAEPGKWRVDKGPIGGDGTHPNALGHKVLGEALTTALGPHT
ncbi:hypothetical protein [Sinomonas sp. ASV322]|uniref:hypothetical protein n=1 Tax=Sinomonas sp. ASV322 TaxID=3041920 RepID=UPI0027DB787E|nr:hypothetical protein [Sinomonas sp. ASV322]MDQ4502196.1 hypothetical protein [Sinomonas sp. ASV322]